MDIFRIKILQVSEKNYIHEFRLLSIYKSKHNKMLIFNCLHFDQRIYIFIYIYIYIYLRYVVEY